MPSRTPNLSLVIPFYNESGNSSIIIDKLTKKLEIEKIDYEILVVDNGSKDNTREILEKICEKNKRVRLIVVQNNKGYGYGIRKGLEFCEGEYIGYIWADDFIGVNFVPELVNKLKSENLSLAKISRFNRGEGLMRKIQSFAYNYLFSTIFDINSTDINGCPKIMKNSFYNSINLKSCDWFLDAEIMLKLNRKKSKFIEIPSNFDKREYGNSNVKIYTFLEFLKNLFIYKKNGY
ncbi:TPA: glycosyltransferase family 2 protein [Candidatus Pacearchaeota archaeon]|jgi:dolichol-phosphate mannosyltransferase|nr:glycosyltransferase family 2 protein [Candidatus Pacearchaeota archaeon]